MGSPDERDRTLRLASVANRLTAAAGHEEVLAAVAHDVPAAVGAADACLGIVRAGCVELLAPDPGAAPIPLTAEHPLAAAVTTGETVVGPRLVAVPLRSPRGDTVMVMGFGWRHRSPPDDATLAVMGTMTTLCAQALGRVEVGLRARQLSDLAGRLATAVTAVEVAEALRDHAAAPLGALYVNCRVVDHRAGVLRWLAPPTVGRDVVDRYDEAPLDAPYPIVDAVLDDVPVWLSSLEEWEARYPSSVEDARAAGISASASLPLHGDGGQVVGVLNISWARPTTFEGLLESAVLTVADLAAQTLERARLTDARSRAAEQNLAVADLGRLVAAAATGKEAAHLLADHAGGVVGATFANVALADATGRELHVLHHAGVDDALAQRYATQPMDRRLPQVDAVLTGKPIFLSSRADVELRYPHVLDDVVAAGLHAVAAMPLLGGDGTAFGSLAFGWSEQQPFDSGQRAVLVTVAELGARTLERAELTDTAINRARAISRLAAALAAASTREEVAAVVADVAPSVVGSAAVVRLWTADDARRALEVLGPPARSPSQPPPAPIPFDARVPVADAHRTGKPVLLGERRARVRRYPHLASHDGGIHASAHLPLHSADGNRTGVVAVEWTGPVRLDEEAVTTLSTVADLTAQALERADLHDTEHALIAGLQQRLIGPVPRVPGFDVAARYIPSTSVGIGGDWYEAIPYRGGSVVVIGDVTGHGVDAVTAMAQLSAVIGGLIRAGEPLDHIFAKASAMLAGDGGRFATALLLHVDPASDDIRYLSAGHPWAMLRHPDGRVEVLDGGRQPLIGTRLRPTPPATAAFPRGALLLAYTDGLVERREEPLSSGIDRLAAGVAALDPSAPLDELLRQVLDASSPAGGFRLPDDDVAMLLLRRR